MWKDLAEKEEGKSMNSWMHSRKKVKTPDEASSQMFHIPQDEKSHTGSFNDIWNLEFLGTTAVVFFFLILFHSPYINF
jgi:hypothetical protein